MNQPAEHTELVEKAFRGDSQAFARLAEDHYRTAYAVAFSMVGQWSAAQDIAQETFLLAWSHRESLRNALAFAGWIRRIATNVSKNWLRSASYRKRMAEHYAKAAPDSATQGDQPDARTDESIRRATVWAALETLSPGLRQAVVLYYLHGEAIRDVASALNITENAAKKRLQHAREKLRAHFDEQWKSEMKRAADETRISSRESRFLSLLALGPAAPELAQSAAATGIGLAIETAMKSGIAHNILLGSATMTAKKATLVGIACASIAASTYWATHRSSQDAGPAVPPSKAEDTVQLAHAGQDQHGIDSESPTPPAEATPAKPAAVEISPDVPQEDEIVPKEIPNPADYAWVEGIVVDKDNRPIAGAGVTVAALGLELPKELQGPLPADPQVRRQAERFREAYERFLRNPLQYWSGTSDVQGRFRIEGIRYQGLGIVSAMADTYSSEIRTVQILPAAAPEFVKLTLHDGLTVRGHVLSSTGSNVTDASIVVGGFLSETEGSSGSIGTAVFTGPHGEFQLALQGPGLLTLLCDSPTFGVATFANIALEPEKELTLQYASPASIAGLVTDQNNVPVASANVELTGQIVTRSGSGMSSRSGQMLTTTTDANGRFLFESVDPAQEYASRVFAPGGEQLAQGPPVRDLKPGTQRELNIKCQNTMKITGHVTGESSGKPLANVHIMAMPEIMFTSPPPNGQIQPLSTISGNDGEYEFTITGDPGAYGVMILAGAYGLSGGYGGSGTPPHVTVELDHGEHKKLDLKAPDPMERAFLVVDTEGNPVGQASTSINVRFPNGGGSGSGVPDHSGDDGRVVIRGIVPDAETWITFRKDGFVDSKSAVVVMEPGQSMAEETVIMHAKTGVEFTVTGPDGTALANIPVTLVPATESRTFDTSKARSDANGLVTVLEEIPSGVVALNIYATTNSDNGTTNMTAVIPSVALTPHAINSLGSVKLRIE
ncbi:MAG: hypothetical protein AMXMBFR84_32530 [Candidatus Hydrogenedentota bacterium]